MITRNESQAVAVTPPGTMEGHFPAHTGIFVSGHWDLADSVFYPRVQSQDYSDLHNCA